MRPAALLLFFSLASPQAMASPCGPNEVLANILGVKETGGEWFRKHFQYKDIKNFNFDDYFKYKDEFDNLKTVGQLPDAPPKSEFERYIAWLDTNTETGERLPTILSVLEKGTETQKAKLHRWIKRVAEKKLTEHQIHEAAVELSLILHNSKINLPELLRHGTNELAEKLVASQYHQHFIHDQLKFILNEGGQIKKENILNMMKRWKETSPGKWYYTAGANIYGISMAKDWGHMLLFALPEHQFAKLAVEDLEIMLKTGGVDSPKFAEIVKKYEGAVNRQVLYNSIHSFIELVEKYVWLEFGLHKWHQYHDRKHKLDQKDHS